MSPSRPIRSLALAATLALAPACGYAPARDALAGAGPLAVVAGPVHVADAEAQAAALAGARTELARRGALGRCDPDADADCAHVVVELLALDDEATGVVAPFGPPDALGVRVTARGRAWLRRGDDPPGPERPAAEASASAVVALPAPHAGAAPLALAARREAARRAARELGARLVRALVSVPEPTGS